MDAMISGNQHEDEKLSTEQRKAVGDALEQLLQAKFCIAKSTEALLDVPLMEKEADQLCEAYLKIQDAWDAIRKRVAKLTGKT